MARYPALVIAATLALAGCVTDGDPAKGGFIAGIVNLSDGTYEQRQQALKTSLENEQDSNTQKVRELERVNAQRTSISAEKAAAEERFAALQEDLAALRSRLAKTEKQNASLKNQTASLERQVSDLEAKVRMVQRDTITPELERQKRLEALRKEKDALEREIEIATNR